MKLFIVVLLAAAPYAMAADSAAAAAAAATGAAAAAAAAATSGNGGAAAAAVAVSDSGLPPPSYSCKCQYIYQPVCGTDGQTYSNECVLKCVSAENVRNNKYPIYVSRNGVCPQEVCHCQPINQPVCGTDGYTYSNECVLRCENNRRAKFNLSPIGIDKRGKCPPRPCVCSDVVIPVCGTNSVTYRNICFLQCASRQSQGQSQPPIYYDYAGACARESCPCSREYQPVCATDGNTYNNQCLLRCENRRRNALGFYALGVRNDGPCYSCNCPDVDDPVCAEDDQTYKNPCFLRCENDARARIKLPPLKTQYKGICGCACKKYYDPVCGSDDQSYDNICQLRCESNRRVYQGKSAIWLAYGGLCVCNCRHCSIKYAPVCGSDGRTYWNRCWLDCHSDCNLRRLRPKITQRYVGYC